MMMMMVCEPALEAPEAQEPSTCMMRSQAIQDLVPVSSCQALRQALAALYRLDDFYLERLGSGFFSDVYKVHHKATQQVMVLKMNMSMSNRPNVLREVELMNRLNHPNILKFRGVCVHEGCLHALTEYMNGGSLEDWIQDPSKCLPWSLRVKLSADMAHGLSYLHSNGVFHRDLTSKNILINVFDDKLTAIVGDFGLADKIPDPIKRNFVRLPTVGSPWYMAPETLTGKWYDQSADVFSFGIILCELIARIASDPDVLPRTPNFGVDYVAFSEMCQDCPPDYLQLCYNCCLVDPKSRPEFKKIASDLESILRRLRTRNFTETSYMTSPPKFLDDVRINWGALRRRQQISPQAQRQSRRRSTSLAYVDRIDMNAAQNRCLGEQMSRNDPHYVPRTANPFAQSIISEEYRDGNKKIIGYSSSLSPTVFEAPTNLRPRDNLTLCIPPFRDSHSCPASPSSVRRFVPTSGPTTSYESSSWHCVRPSSPDSELAYYSQSENGSFGDSSSPKSSSRCSNDSDTPTPRIPLITLTCAEHVDAAVN